MEGCGDGAVAAGSQVQVVEHVSDRDGSVGVEERGTHVQELDGPHAVQRRAQQVVHRRILLPQRVGAFPPGQQTLRRIERAREGR